MTARQCKWYGTARDCNTRPNTRILKPVNVGSRMSFVRRLYTPQFLLGSVHTYIVLLLESLEVVFAGLVLLD